MAGEAGVEQSQEGAQSARLPSCLTPVVSSGVLKTARCFSNLLEGQIELMEVVMLLGTVYYRERIRMKRKQPVKWRIGQRQESSRCRGPSCSLLVDL